MALQPRRLEPVRRKTNHRRMCARLRIGRDRNDNNGGSWDPVDIAATIEFKGKQVCRVLEILSDPADLIRGNLGEIHVPCRRDHAMVVCCA